MTQILCEIPQFKNPFEVRVWFKKHVHLCSKCQLENLTRKIKERQNLKNKIEELNLYKIKKEFLDLELEEYFIPSTPNSPDSIKSCVSMSNNFEFPTSTQGISEGFELIDFKNFDINNEFIS